jgi:hypothetical protein
MSGFTGMVVAPGSPHDGLVLDAKTPFYRLADPVVPKATRLTSKQKPVEETVKTSSFIWLSFEARKPDREWGFWVPEGRDAAWAMYALVVGYQRGVRR